MVVVKFKRYVNELRLVYVYG